MITFILIATMVIGIVLSSFSTWNSFRLFSSKSFYIIDVEEPMSEEEEEQEEVEVQLYVLLL